MRSIRYVSITIIMALCAAPASAVTWYVHPGGAGDALTIQGGVNLAASGDIVLVASGTYTGAGNVNVNFGGKAIAVTSESGAYFTVIDCQNTAQGFIFENGETSSSVLDGFTIRNGSGVKGGAIYCDEVSVTIRHNILINNYASTSGGAIHAKKGAALIYNNTLDGNNSPVGGGISFQGPSSPQVYQNIICNSAAGGAFSCAGSFGGLVACNDVYANTGGNTICAGGNGTNFSLDPLFCGIPGSGNFFLQQTSPCAPAFSPCAQPIGALDVQCQVTATSPVSWGKVKNLYR